VHACVEVLSSSAATAKHLCASACVCVSDCRGASSTLSPSLVRSRIVSNSQQSLE
jgi:hypothetical protein